MKISAMKKLLLLIVMCICAYQGNAQFNYTYTDETTPVVGIQYGVVGGGHTAMLFNRDDVESELINPATMNFTYFAGAERIRWYVPHFGVGQQVLFWNAGAKYTGQFTAGDNVPTFTATTSLTYAKIPLLFYWKSYSRWHPDRRMRANAYFGPYISMLMDAMEESVISVPGTDIQDTYTLKSGSYIGKNKDGDQFFDGNADDGQLFKMFDWGFTMGAGVEFRLWRKTVIALTLRSDLGMAEVENKDFQVDAPGTNTRYRYYKDITEKYVPYTAAAGPTFDSNRPETRTFSLGAQLSIKKYIGVK